MVQTGELKNIINEILGIQFNIEKARLDGKVQNLATYINETTLKSSHKEMDGKKAKGIDGVAKEDYSVNLEANVEHLFDCREAPGNMAMKNSNILKEFAK